jgi:hypothetical protein
LRLARGLSAEPLSGDWMDLVFGGGVEEDEEDEEEGDWA